jgi:DNA-binding transcriptional LysR family regulator
MSDYLALVIMPKLIKTVTQIAPNTRIIQHAINHLDSLKPFEESSLDIAIGQFIDAPQSLKVTSLFSDKGIIAADKKHPIFQKKEVTLKEYAKYPQVFVSLESQPDQNALIKHIEDQGCKLNVALMTPHTIIALQTLPGTLLISNVVEHLANPFVKPLGLSIHETPYKVKKYHAQMYWHPRDQNDSGHQWLRELVKNISKSI